MFTTFVASLPLRVLLALLTSFIVAVMIGPQVIANLKLRQIGQTIREEGVQAHKKKAGIPTMGGMIILLPTLLTCLFWAEGNARVFLTIFALVATGFIGLLDDLTKVIKARSLGLTPRQKLAGQITAGLVVAMFIRFMPSLSVMIPPGASSATVQAVSLPASVIQVPLFGILDIGWLFLPLAVFVFVGSTNAVNLTDGLDGLAGGTASCALAAFLVLALISGNLEASRWLGVLWMPGSGELAVICAALLGGCLGFLWFNSHPAMVFMGDTGSLALGGTLGAMAICLKLELFLGIIGGIFVAEALSVIIQVSYFKYTGGRRVFRMSPIHHHFELGGWAEEKVVGRFWITGFLFAVVGLSLFAFRIIFV